MIIIDIKRTPTILFAIICLVMLISGCETSETISHAGNATQESTGAFADNAAQGAVSTPAEYRPLEINVIENRQDELVFDISIDDYINAYNSLYLKDKHVSYLTPSDNWDKEMFDTAIHSDHKTAKYTFAEDKRILTIPTVWVYAPSDKAYITEITVNFDDHGYSESLYDLYDEMCFYTLKVFLPDLKDEDLISLRDAINYSAYEDCFVHSDGYRYGSVPKILYYRKSIGVYPYFAIGEYVHLCILPVDDAMLNEFRSKGVELIEIT